LSNIAKIMTTFAKTMTNDKQQACQSKQTLATAQVRIADFIRNKRGRVILFYDKYYTGDLVSYRTVHRVLFEDDEDYHGIWENAAEYYAEEKLKEDHVNKKITKAGEK